MKIYIQKIILIQILNLIIPQSISFCSETEENYYVREFSNFLEFINPKTYIKIKNIPIIKKKQISRYI